MKFNVTINNYLSLENLRKDKEIGNRSYNALLSSKVYTVQDIVLHYKKYGTFLNIKNIGELSNRELIDVVKKYKIAVIDLPFSLSDLQEKYFSEFVDFIFTYYLNKKVAKYLDTSHNDYTSVVKMITDLEGDIRKTSNRSVIIDFYAIKHHILNFVAAVSDVLDKWTLVTILVQAGFYFLGYGYENIDFEKINNPFKLIYLTIYNEKIFTDREKIIIRNCFYFEESKEKRDKYESCLKDLAKKIKLSSERVRQVRGELFFRILEYLKISTLFKDVIKEKYHINYDGDVVFTSRNISKEISETEGYNISHNFFNLVLNAILHKTHTIVGIVRYTLFQHNVYFNNTSLYNVKRELAALFDFNSFIKKVTLRYKTAIKKDEVYNLVKYVEKYFVANVNDDNKQRIYNIIKQILENDYDIKVENGKIIFKRTSKPTLHELIYQVLKENGRPMNIDEIFEEVKKLRSKISKDSIRSTVVTDKDTFVSFNRNSTYAIKEIIDGENIKAGTIRKIAQEYIEQFRKPVSVDEVVSYVQKYRDASRSSILSNIKLDSSHIFIFYKDKTMGLSTKPYYKPEDENLVPTRWEKNYKLLLEFLEKYGRYPRLNFDDKDELLVYKFCRLNAILYSRNKLHKYLLGKLKEINFDFDMSKWGYLKELKKNHKA